MNVVFFLLCDSPASEFYVPTFRDEIAGVFIQVNFWQLLPV
jgi:hypothetical protein